MRSRLFLVLLLAVVVAGGTVFAAGGAESRAPGAVRTMRLATNHTEGTHASLGYELFARRVNELTDGEIQINIFYNSVLGSSREVMEQAQSGALDMTHISAGFVSAFVPVYDVFSVPYIFRSHEHYWNVLKGPIGDDLMAEMEGVGIKQLFWVDSGARSFYNNVRPIRTPADLRGMQIRVMGSPVMFETIELFGATPTATAFAEVYNALQTRVIDGAENNPISVTSMQHHEASRFYSLNEHMRIPDMLLMSLDLYNTLTPSQRAAFEQAAAEAEDFIREEYARQESQSLSVIATNTQINEIDDLTPFIEITAPLHQKLAPQFGGILERILETE